MAKRIYRLCLIACLVLAILAGLFYYNKVSKSKEHKVQDLILVEHIQTERGSVTA